MLRRVARALKALLVVAAIALLVWLPVSFIRVLYVAFPLADGEAGVVSDRGYMLLWHATPSRFPKASLGVHDLRRWDDFGDPRAKRGAGRALWPHTYKIALTRIQVYHFSIPLWLLAVLCLAWPVTSFVIARRRRGTRGFEVEAVDSSAVSTVDS
jgi:hypothetical protein